MKLQPIHPGEVLLHVFIIPSGLSQRKFAKASRIPFSVVNKICRGKRPINAKIAVKLAKFWKNNPMFWMNLQSQYEVETVLDKKR